MNKKRNNTRNQNATNLKIAFCVSFLVLLLGFGALNIFWIFDPQIPSLPGLYDYMAATWGDGLFLPIGAGALVYYFLSNKNCCTKGIYTFSFLALLIGVLIGAFSQWSWLANENIEANWTIPQPGYFTSAGWYHAVFFTCSIGFYSCFLALFLGMRFTQRGKELGTSNSLTEILIWIAAFGYCSMHLLDDYLESYSVPELAFFLVVAGFLLGVIVYALTKEKYFAISVFRTVPGLLLGVGLLVFFGTELSQSLMVVAYWLALSAILIAVFSPSVKETNSSVRLRLIATITASLGSSLVVLGISSLGVSNGEINWLWYLLGAVVLALFLTFSLSSNESVNSENDMSIRGAGIVLSATLYLIIANLSFEPQGLITISLWNYSFSREISFQEAITHVLLYSILFALCIAQVRSFVGYLNKVEGGDGDREEKSKATQRLQIIVYLQLAFIMTGVFVLLVFSRLALTLLNMNHLWTLATMSFASLQILWLVCLLIVLCLVIWVASKRMMRSVLSCLVLFLSVLAAYALLMLGSNELRMPLIADWWSVWALLVCVGVPIFIGESFINNCTLLRGGVPKYRDVFLGLLLVVCNVGLSVGAVLPTLGAGTAFHPTIISPGISIIAILIGYIAIPVLCTHGYMVSQDRSKQLLIYNTAALGVMQNGMAAAVVILFLGVLPLEIYLGSNFMFAVIAAFVLLLVVTVPKICFPLGFNRKYLQDRLDESKAKGLTTNERAQSELRELSLHYQRQAVLVFVMLLPWSLFMVCAFGIRNKPANVKQITRKEFFETIWLGLLLRAPSKEGLMPFFDLLPELRDRYSSQLDDFAEDGLAAVQKNIVK